MRPTGLLAALVVLAGCSFLDPGDPVPFRALAQAEADGPLPIRYTLLASQAEVDAFLDASGIAATVTADFARETVLVVGTPGACPATNYRVTVRSLEPDPANLVITAEVERVGDAGGDALTYPVAFVAVEDLSRSGAADPFANGLALRQTGAVSDCTLE